jgi:IS5 family transposase
MNHALVKLARTIDWRFLEEKFGAEYTDKPGQPPLPTRLMAGLAILKHTSLSDEALCDRWVENPSSVAAQPGATRLTAAA